MNKTELKAYNWLIGQGHHIQITNSKDSPDLVVDDGRGYEVKLLRGNTITFSPGQLDRLKRYPHDVDVLVFRDQDNEPHKVIPIAEISGGKFLDETCMINVNSITRHITIPVSSEEKYIIKLMATSTGRKLSDVVREIIIKWVMDTSKSGKFAGLIAEGIGIKLKEVDS